MNAVLYINRTFTEVTPESAEEGDFSAIGFIEQDQPVTFRELVNYMKNHNEASHTIDGNWHPSTDTWFTCYSFTSCYRTGTERQESIHYSSNNHPRNAKYWIWAYKAANKKVN